jgi:hypothetical protein
VFCNDLDGVVNGGKAYRMNSTVDADELSIASKHLLDYYESDILP